jgi:hypothetical protein
MSYISEITKLFEDELDANIMCLLDFFGPMKLETMHNLLGKAKTTILDHLKVMVEKNQIEVDKDLTAQKFGKFYALTPEIKEILNRDDEEEIVLKKDTLEELDVDKVEFVKAIANVQRTIGFQANLFSRLSATYLENNIDLFDDVEKNKEHLRGFVAGNYELIINSDEEFKEVQEILRNFSNNLKKYEKSKRKKGKHTLMVFMLGVPKEKVGPD